MRGGRVAVVVFEKVSTPRGEGVGVDGLAAKTTGLVGQAVHAHLDAAIRVDTELQAQGVDVRSHCWKASWEQ